MRGQRVDQLRKARLVLEERGDVVKKNPRLGKIGYSADQFLQVLYVDRLRGFRHGGA
jgi:hypothetical protein